MGKYRRLISRMVGSMDYWAQAAMRRFVLDIDRRMKAQNVSRAELAERLQSTPAYVTKVMRGDVNFTLETMTKLALAVGGKLQVRVVDGDVVSEVNRVMVHGEVSQRLPSVWHSERAKQSTAAANTKRLELNLGGAANQPCYDNEKTGSRAA